MFGWTLAKKHSRASKCNSGASSSGFAVVLSLISDAFIVNQSVTYTTASSSNTAVLLRVKKSLTSGVYLESIGGHYLVGDGISPLSANGKSGDKEFVLTHGDLSPRNIMVQDGIVTGIIDWERSGFFPRYAEYAFAMRLCHTHEKWWIPVLKELLEPCSKDRLEFTRLVEDRGW